MFLFCFQTKSSLPGSEDNFWIRYWCYIPQNGIGQWWTTFVSRLSFYVWPQHTDIAYLLSEAKDSESLSMTINSFPKRLVDLVNLFQLKGLTILIYFIWHVILLIRKDWFLQMQYDGTGTLYLIFIDFCYFMIYL